MPFAPHGRNGQIAHLYRSVKCLCKSIHIPLTLFSFLSTSFTLSRFGGVRGTSIPCALYPSSTTIEMPNISIHRNAVSQRLHSGTRFFAIAATTVLRCRLPCRKIYYYLWSWRKFICRMVVWPRSVQQRQCSWKKELAKRTLNSFTFFSIAVYHNKDSGFLLLLAPLSSVCNCVTANKRAQRKGTEGDGVKSERKKSDRPKVPIDISKCIKFVCIA